MAEPAVEPAVEPVKEGHPGLASGVQGGVLSTTTTDVWVADPSRGIFSHGAALPFPHAANHRYMCWNAGQHIFAAENTLPLRRVPQASGSFHSTRCSGRPMPSRPCTLRRPSRQSRTWCGCRPIHQRCNGQPLSANAAMADQSTNAAMANRCNGHCTPLHAAAKTCETTQCTDRDGPPLQVNGSNACVFCYGQTGSGKTHTMFGGTTADGAAGGSRLTAAIPMQNPYCICKLTRARLLAVAAPLDSSGLVPRACAQLLRAIVHRQAAAGAGPPQHGLQPDTMALITSDCGRMRYRSIKWP